MKKKTIRDIVPDGKRVLVRVDFNVPIEEDGCIGDDTRIRDTLPTLQYLRDRGCRVIICSHLDRPDGKVIESLRMGPVAERLSLLIGRPVNAIRTSCGPGAESAVSMMREGDFLFLENIRFNPGEKTNGPELALALADLADIYVNDAFGVCHRSHASVVGVPRFLPAVAGLLLEKEVDTFDTILEDPERPFAAVVGGAKISDKLGMLEYIVPRVDRVLLGGGMTATFLLCMGYSVGASRVEKDLLEKVQEFRNTAESLGVPVSVPEDVVVAERLERGAKVRTVPVTGIPDGWVIADIGRKTIRRYSRELSACRTVIWNGPLGMFELPEFSEGTRSIAQILAGLNGTTVTGGGSTAEAVTMMGLAGKMSHVSTGGGAALQLLAGKTLPGVEALLDA
jgi:phosphoglycerate kinase